jgi:threonyl-tRNA synthetase
LLEYYGGAFPVWCSPVQVCAIPVGESCEKYCKDLVERFRKKHIRAEVDDSSNSFNKKIRTNTIRKIPVMLIVGEKEMETNSVTVRRYGEEQQKTLSVDEFESLLLQEIKDRVMSREPMGSII